MGGACGKANGTANSNLNGVLPAQPSQMTQASSTNPKSFDSAYELGDVLGGGSFGDVLLATRKNNPKQSNVPTEVAVKVVRKECNDEYDEAKQQLLNEYGILMELKHQHVINAHDLFEEGSQDLFLVIDLCRGGEFLDILAEQDPAFAEPAAIGMCQNLLSAINYLHDNQIVHRDLKLENLLLKRRGDVSSILIADFGLACKMGKDTDMNTFCGSAGPYIAPEVKELVDEEDAGARQVIGFGVDVWCMGIIAHIMLCGREPDFTPKREELYDEWNLDNFVDSDAADEVTYSFTDVNKQHKTIGLSADAHNFVTSMLTIQSQDRPTAQSMLAHPWLK